MTLEGGVTRWANRRRVISMEGGEEGRRGGGGEMGKKGEEEERGGEGGGEEEGKENGGEEEERRRGSRRWQRAGRGGRGPHSHSPFPV